MAICQVATRLEHSLELDQMTPRRSTATTAFDYLQDTFGAGNAFPYTLVIEPPEGTEQYSDFPWDSAPFSGHCNVEWWFLATQVTHAES